jgi:hypothetical protein
MKIDAFLAQLDGVLASGAGTVKDLFTDTLDPDPVKRKQAAQARAPGQRETIADLAKEARGSIERLIEGLGWTWDEALSRAIDRCDLLEEETRTDASR